MAVKRSERKEEAVKRLKLMKAGDFIIKDLRNGLLHCTEPYGATYYVSDEMAEKIEKLEEKYDMYIYHVIHSYHPEIGDMYSYLYVCKDKEEWEYDIDDIKNGCILAYTENVTCPDFSEFGCIGYRPLFGGLVRTA